MSQTTYTKIMGGKPFAKITKTEDIVVQDKFLI